MGKVHAQEERDSEAIKPSRVGTSRVLNKSAQFYYCTCSIRPALLHLHFLPIPDAGDVSVKGDDLHVFTPLRPCNGRSPQPSPRARRSVPRSACSSHRACVVFCSSQQRRREFDLSRKLTAAMAMRCELEIARAQSRRRTAYAHCVNGAAPTDDT